MRPRVSMVALAAGIAVGLCGLAAAPAGADWTAPQTVSPSDQYVDTPAVAADSSGDAAIAWSDYIDSYDSSLEVVVRHDYGAYSQAQMVSDGQPGQNSEPAVAVAPDGAVAVVWTQNTSSGDLIRIAFGSASGGSFTAPQTIEGPEPGQGLHHPVVGYDSAGGLLVIWAPLDGSIHYVSRPAGATSFGPIGQLANPGSPDLFNPVFVVGPNGDAVAAWADYQHVYAATKAPGEPFGSAQTILNGCEEGPLYAAIDANGDSVVDWTATDSSCDGGVSPTWVKAAYRPAGDAFGSVETVAQMGAWAWAGGAAISSEGQATVAVLGNMTSPISTTGVTAVTRTGPGSWGQAQPVTTATDVNDPPVLSYDSSGNLWAAWDTRTNSQSDGTPASGEFAAEEQAGGSFSGQATALQQVSGQIDTVPVLAGAGDGVVAAWATGVVNEFFDGQTASYEPAESQTQPPPTSTSGSTGGAVSSPASSQSGPTVNVKGVDVGGGQARRWRLTVSGRAGRAETVIVRVLRGGRLVRRSRVKVRQGRYRATLVLVGQPPGWYRIQVVLLLPRGRRTVRQRLVTEH